MEQIFKDMEVQPVREGCVCVLLKPSDKGAGNKQISFTTRVVSCFDKFECGRLWWKRTGVMLSWTSRCHAVDPPPSVVEKMLYDSTVVDWSTLLVRIGYWAITRSPCPLSVRNRNIWTKRFMRHDPNLLHCKSSRNAACRSPGAAWWSK